MKVKNRKELFEHLENIMARTYEKIKEEGKLEYEQNLLKSFIIESNEPNLNSLKQSQSKEFKIDIFPTEDKTLHVLNIGLKEKKKAVFYVDSFNPRFWIFHTTSKSILVNTIIKKLVGVIGGKLDHPWLYTNFLDTIRKESTQVRGTGIQYKYGEVFPDENQEVEEFSMRIWGSMAQNIIEQLRRSPQLKHTLTLSSIGIKQEYNNDFVIEDITYWGRFLARGTSIQAHLEVVENIQKKYQSILSQIEKERITYRKREHSIKIEGRPLLITFKKKIEDLNKFLEVVVSSKIPFRLWGIKTFIEKDFALVIGIDLHNGDKFSMEVTPVWIRFYLPEGACGNTVIRLVTNLQKYYDADTKLEGIENGRII